MITHHPEILFDADSSTGLEVPNFCQSPRGCQCGWFMEHTLGSKILSNCDSGEFGPMKKEELELSSDTCPGNEGSGKVAVESHYSS